MIIAAELFDNLCGSLEIGDEEIDRGNVEGVLVLKRFVDRERIDRSLRNYCRKRNVEIKFSDESDAWMYFTNGDKNVFAGMCIVSEGSITTFCFVSLA